MKLAILGGSGLAGFRIAKRCAHMPALAGGEIILLGRDTQKVASAAADIAETNPPCALSWSFADATDITSLRTVFLDCDLAVAATNGGMDLDPLLRAALLTDTDLLDILPSTPQKIRFLQQHAGAAVSKGLCFITDGGLLPGLPGALARLAAQETLAPSRLEAFASFNLDWRNTRFSSDARMALLEDVIAMSNAEVWENGVWCEAPHYPRIHFGPNVGLRRCAPMGLQEVRELPLSFPSLQKAGFYMGGFGFFFDRVLMKPLLALARRAPAQQAFYSKLFFSLLRRFAPHEPWFRLRLEAEGCAGETMTYLLETADPYELAALAACATIDRYSLGYRPRGLWTQAAYIDPKSFFAFLEKEGLVLTRGTGI